MSDLDLLRRYEPVVRFTDGELFFPCAVDGYVHKSSLWLRGRNGRSRMLARSGTLDLDSLAEHGAAATERGLYMRFVEEPLSPREYQKWLLRPRRIRFHAPGRLARVPPWSRLLDSAFDFSLLIRGRVPGGTTAAAEIKYHDLHSHDPRRVYYARVLTAGCWTVLNYLFFYAMNDWRSTFHGANDHEADWEQIFVYLYQTPDGPLAPRWVAFASHDYHGDDLRRRWDDPLLTKEGTHPVVFAAAGSHSSYFEQGEYLMGVEPRFLRPVKRFTGATRRFWAETLKQGRQDVVSRTAKVVNVPFVDYARGDGEVIGPGGHSEWTPVVISDDLPWVSEYRGLWGLDTHDPFGGERAPAGPKYERTGSIRLSWYDPLGFAGLDKVVPPPQLAPALEARGESLASEIADLGREIRQKRQAIQVLSLDEEALRETEYMSALHSQTLAELAEADVRLGGLKSRKMQLSQTRDAVELYAARISSGVPDSPTAHLHAAHHPDPSPAPRRLLQIWAALSGAISLLSFGLLLVFRPSHWLFWVLVLCLIYATIEAAAEARLINFLLSVTVVMAAISAAILVWEYWRLVVLIALGIAILLMIRDNVRELRGV